MGIQCFAGEAPFLFLSGTSLTKKQNNKYHIILFYLCSTGWFLKKIGHVHTMTIILLAMGVRLLSYSFLTNPWSGLPIELLNGLTLGVYWSTMASYAFHVAPPGSASTLQGIFGAIFEGIGNYYPLQMESKTSFKPPINNTTRKSLFYMYV